jgi:hypothetical protein
LAYRKETKRRAKRARIGRNSLIFADKFAVTALPAAAKSFQPLALHKCHQLFFLRGAPHYFVPETRRESRSST